LPIPPKASSPPEKEKNERSFQKPARNLGGVEKNKGGGRAHGRLKKKRPALEGKIKQRIKV